MSTFGPDPGGDAIADWPRDDTDADWDADDWHTAPTPARPRREVEVIPSRWPNSDEEPGPSPTSRRRRWVIVVGALAGAAIAAALWWLLGGRTAAGPTVTITPATPSDPAPTQPQPGPELTSEVPVPTIDAPVPTGQPATGPAADVAAGFAADYGNPGTGKDDWLNRVSRWTAPLLADGYRLTDPNRLPSAQFQRLSAPLNNDSATIVYNAFYDTMTLEIRVAFIGDRWQVIAALDTEPLTDLSPPGSSAPVTTPYLPPDIATTQP
ncbi:hypothetical protein [Mycobacterium hubeiense]|uniref:hypothetical protein n=1 Tax=Mycobacterium hubeiense TaxID=1867256 RepID=UPI000C7F62AE|nr:hypothetical protein [Mycobacterium sp. QGD 101]